MTEYRVRFESLSGHGPLTAKPGIIKRNMPRALRVLKWMQTPDPGTGLVPDEAWIEKRDSPDSEWERLP